MIGSGNSVVTDQVTGNRIEQRRRLRADQVPEGTTVVVRGGADTRDKLRQHAQRTARAWSLDGQPFLGVSVFAVLDMPLDNMLRQRFGNFRTVYLPTADSLTTHGFELLPTGQRPHFTVRLRHANDSELDRLLDALGDVQPNPQYAKGEIRT
jgi:hypothetical protein